MELAHVQIVKSSGYEVVCGFSAVLKSPYTGRFSSQQ